MTDQAAPFKQRASGRIDALSAEILGLSHDIHASPELGFEETRAAAWVAGAVQRWTDSPVEIGIGQLPTAVRAKAGDGDLVITLCAEYDALPDIGHGCGHNIIASAATGAFAALAPSASELGLTVQLLGTPAEEGGGGKITLLGDGAFGRTHAAMMVHPAPEDFLAMQPYASAHIEVEFHGEEAHASLSPHEGANALDALTLTLTAIGLARQQLEPGQQIHGYVRHGGTAANVIPGKAGGAWIVRGECMDSLERAVNVLRRCALGSAMAAGVTAEISEGAYRYANLKTDPLLSTALQANAKHVGRTLDAVMERGGSTDMGNVSLRFPSIHPMLGIGTGDGQPVSMHTKEFAALAGGPTGDRAVLDGARLLAWTAIDVALNPTTRAELLSNAS